MSEYLDKRVRLKAELAIAHKATQKAKRAAQAFSSVMNTNRASAALRAERAIADQLGEIVVY